MCLPDSPDTHCSADLPPNSPTTLKLVMSYENLFDVDSLTIVRKISEREGEFEVKNILKDKEARVLRGAIIARHDVRSERIFTDGKALLTRLKICRGLQIMQCGCCRSLHTCL